MAVRRELVFDECGGASRRRRQAHVFLTAQINNLTRRAEKGIRADPLANCRRIFSPLHCLCVFLPFFPFREAQFSTGLA